MRFLQILYLKNQKNRKKKSYVMMNLNIKHYKNFGSKLLQMRAYNLNPAIQVMKY